MALKDLVADRSKLTEAAIEEIVSEFVRYDPTAYEVVLTPAGLSLNNDAKVLVVLVAIAGWQYVVDEVRPVDTRPAALEATTGIPGGTLRPVLKKLKDAHLVASADEGYSVRAANLDAVGRVVAGEKAVAARRPARKPRNAAVSEENGPDAEDDDSQVLSSAKAGGASKATRKTGVPNRRSLNRLLDEGFFAEPRTLGQVVDRLHEMAIIARNTSLSGPIADMVREGKLTRKKIMDGAKEVWSYRSAT